MTIIVIWLVLALIVAIAANTRGRNAFGWLVLAVVISPLLAGLLLLALPKMAEHPDGWVNVKCPYCAEIVKASASVCRHCKSDLPKVTYAAPTPSKASPIIAVVVVSLCVAAGIVAFVTRETQRQEPAAAPAQPPEHSVRRDGLPSDFGSIPAPSVTRTTAVDEPPETTKSTTVVPLPTSRTGAEIA